MAAAIRLQRSQVVRIAELGAPLLEDGPVPVAAIASEVALKMLAKIELHAIVVEQRVVAIQKKDDVVLGHSLVPASVGLCHSP